ncbi:glutamine synthetase family protein [Aquamicrobium defluvii]|uniref:Glutamine synthetase n=1 Tax=Aquamicrobium defluvii TaxID=69279 RepID=A0A011TRN8_9HYPH|nr:glutamine synthetase family protein [Aquamicrobium defluvii]EXL06767.1 glutamine synthetase [Aquamicrobium defluvii]EZQ15796.1 glutamine synthetase [Halopseudomonas bauzanensis]TDR35925.1 glutamine synthetase [Aquamicrobium defluvii]
MKREEIVMLCTSDLGGQVRGKGFPARDYETRLRKGIGWTPTNSMITAHGPIAPSPWGPFGDTVLVPDPDTHVRVDFGPDHAAENFIMGDICLLDGTPWPVCPRSFLKRVVAALEERHGLCVRAAFEHEFIYDGVDERPNASYALDAFRRQDLFAETYLGALQQAGLELDTFMPEYGPMQYEVTVGPAVGLKAADQAVAVRETARAVATRLGGRVSFTPILRPDAVGNGVHVHFSLFEAGTGQPVNHDPDHKDGLSDTAGAFISGILAKMPSITALTAASTISYLRLTPNRWSAAYNNLGYRDREAGVRICPVFAGNGADISRQYHFEFRAADAAASPYLVLGAILASGLHGLDRGLPIAQVCEGAPQSLPARDLERLGITRLPQSLDAALDLFEADADMDGMIGAELKQAYLAHKRFEASLMRDLSDEDQCSRYRAAY